MVYGTAFTSKYQDPLPLEHFKGDYDEELTRSWCSTGTCPPPRAATAP